MSRVAPPAALRGGRLPETQAASAIRGSSCWACSSASAALTRNEAAWLGLAWAIVAWSIPGTTRTERVGLIAVPALIAVAVFVPWAIRDWLAFGSPLPGQAVANALSLDGRDIFAWSDPPTLQRYLAAGLPRFEGGASGFAHNLLNVLLLLGLPISVIGLAALPWFGRGRALRPLVLFSALTFAITTLLFPVATTWGTFLHAAGAIHVLLIITCLMALDWLIAAVGIRRSWTRPVAWLAPTLTVFGAVLFSLAALPAFGEVRGDDARPTTPPSARSVARPARRSTPTTRSSRTSRSGWRRRCVSRPWPCPTSRPRASPASPPRSPAPASSSSTGATRALSRRRSTADAPGTAFRFREEAARERPARHLVSLSSTRVFQVVCP